MNIFKKMFAFSLKFSLNYKLSYTRCCCSTQFDIPLENIRNFGIIAHVDHGKSTLADRLLESAGVLKKSANNQQVLDRLQVERERGITVKAQSASLLYKYKDTTYLLNLIDTPGHVDFSNEVSRSLSACQGVILLVDANDGVQAQTVANFYLALGQNIVIIPVLNKIDLSSANPERVCSQLKNLFDVEVDDVLRVSAKHGTGIDSVFAAIIDKIPPPEVRRDAPMRSLVFDSYYDRYRGTLTLLYVQDGQVNVGDSVTSYMNKTQYEVKSLSLLRPDEVPIQSLKAGQIGQLGCNMRNTKASVIGDTIYCSGMESVEPLQGFQTCQPKVFAGIYPVDQSQSVHLRTAIEKLKLNDSAVTIAPDSSPALGMGWRLGFLGLLHLEVFSQRLEQEYSAETILTSPSVTYKIFLKATSKTKKENNDCIYVNNPANFPDHLKISETHEPMVIGTIIAPNEYFGSILSLCIDRRGIQRNVTNIDDSRMMMQFDLPLNEVIVDFHDALKTISSGYATFDYEDNGYKLSSLVKMNILLNGKAVDELSTIVHTSRVQLLGRSLVTKLQEIIPRQMVQINIQASCNGHIVARETLKAFRKDVTAKLYGGDVTRRMKLLAQQTAGKKKMRQVANINLPNDTFIKVLKK